MSTHEFVKDLMDIGGIGSVASIVHVALANLGIR